MLKISNILSRKLSSGNKQVNRIRIICFTSIAISAFSLALGTAIMSGFEKETHKKLQGIHRDLIIHNKNKASLDYIKINNFLKSNFKNSIVATAPYTNRFAIIQKIGSEDISNVIMLQAIEPNADQKTRNILLNKNIKLENLIKKNKILVGESLLKNLNIKIGDKISIIFSTKKSKNSKIYFEKIKLTVGGSFKTGIEDFDTFAIFCTYKTMRDLFPEIAVEEIGVKLKSHVSEEKISKTLSKKLNLEVYSWKKLYSPIISALALEKYAMILILILFLLISSTSIVAVISLYASKMEGTLTVLKAMGTSNKKIKLIFLIIGMRIVASANIIGLTAAYISIVSLNKFKLIKLPETYYSSHLPADSDPKIILFVAATVFLVGFIACCFAAKSSSRINIASKLKSEF